ncbi:MAG TPA: phosphotransferase [Nocardioides sp.]|uniref:phosphotransferase n=1 Tax=uncultured Nocardioides sp. TaxID=198441 RepID=UPI00260CD977|nr:phosphotransferase [uncultured Nocardioides sp.]HRK44989.1 phosphotransferase [Nocardioides sp.]
MRPSPVPHGRTARRLEWAHLPPAVRAAIEEQCGAPVVAATSQTSGFTPGFASVLECSDGSRHFVKAASTKAQRMFADAYREEARKLAALPASAPAPPLRWTVDVEDWFALSTEYVEARQPSRPWVDAELRPCLDALTAAVPVLTPAPTELALPPAAEEFAAWPSYWEHLRRTQPDLPHLEAAAELAGRYVEAMTGETLVHTDVRDDNLLLTADGRVLLCDWNWPMIGAAWLDSLFLLIGPRGDGLDVESILSTHPLLSVVPAEHVDIVLALVIGYFLKSADDPVPATSPYIRDAQRWQGEVCWDWLSERRGWR